MSMTWSYGYSGDMLRLYRKAFAATKAGRRVRLRWTDSGMDLDAWRAEFMLALHRRINAKGGPEPSYRKLEAEWQIGCRRDQGRKHQFETPEVAERFGRQAAKFKRRVKPKSVEKIVAEFRAKLAKRRPKASRLHQPADT